MSAGVSSLFGVLKLAKVDEQSYGTAKKWNKLYMIQASGDCNKQRLRTLYIGELIALCCSRQDHQESHHNIKAIRLLGEKRLAAPMGIIVVDTEPI